jgi:hypothetical protein
MRIERVFTGLCYRDGHAYTVWREYRWNGDKVVSISSEIKHDLA